jgi:hypothetical protein
MDPTCEDMERTAQFFHSVETRAPWWRMREEMPPLTLEGSACVDAEVGSQGDGRPLRRVVGQRRGSMQRARVQRGDVALDSGGSRLERGERGCGRAGSAARFRRDGCERSGPDHARGRCCGRRGPAVTRARCRHRRRCGSSGVA